MEGEAEIDQRISALKLDLQDLGIKIVSHINDLYSCGEISSTVNLKDNPRNCIKSLRYDMDDILRLACESQRDMEAHARELDNCEKLVSTLESINFAAETLMKLDDALNSTVSCDMKGINKLVDEAQEAVKNLPSASADPTACTTISSLRVELSILLSQYAAKLRQLLSRFIRIENGIIQVFSAIAPASDGDNVNPADDENEKANLLLNLHDYWEACIHANMAESLIALLCDCIWRLVLRPLWKERGSAGTIAGGAGRGLSSSSAGGSGSGAVGTAATGSDLSPHLQRANASTNGNAKRSTLLLPSISSNNFGGKLAPAQALPVLPLSPSGTYPLTLEAETECTSKLPLPALCENLAAVISFVGNELLCANEKLLPLAHAALFQAKPLELGACLRHTVLAALPQSEHSFATFKASLEKPCKDLDLKISSTFKMPIVLNTAQSTGQVNGTSPLVEMVQNLSNNFCEHRRKTVLAKAREILLADYHNTMVATGDCLEDDVTSAGQIGDTKAMLEQSGSCAMQALNFDCCQISLAAWRILRHCHDTMKEACKSNLQAVAGGQPTTLSFVLYQAARDCLDIFAAVIPAKFGNVIDAVPRMGAVFYNDCAYIAHNCMLMTFHYRNGKEGLVSPNNQQHNDPMFRENIAFIDFIPRFRALGQKCLAKHMDLQKAELTQYLQLINICPKEMVSSYDVTTASNANGSSEDAAGVDSSTSINASHSRSTSSRIGSAIARLANSSSNSVGRSASSKSGRTVAMSNNDEGAILIVKHFESVRGQWQSVLPDVIYDRVVGYLIEYTIRHAVQPVHEAECITAVAATDISRIFYTIAKCQDSLNDDGSGSAQEQLQHRSRVVPSYAKFCVIAELLESKTTMSDIADWLPRKKFVGFTASELSSLIKALYDDSERRQHILHKIMEMSK